MVREDARFNPGGPAAERQRSAAGGVAAIAALAMGACAAPTAQSRDYAWESSVLNLMDQPEDRMLARAEAPPEPAEPRPSPRPLRLRPAWGARQAAPSPAPPPQADQPAQTAQPTAPVERSAERGEGAADPEQTPVIPTQLPAAPATAPAPQGDQSLRAVQRVEAAQTLLGTPGLQERAFVAHVLRAAGQDIAVDAKQPYAASLWRKLESAGGKVAVADAKPGDLIFFRDTADLNGNGRPDDGVTLVGVVERVRGNHAVFIAQRAGKVRRMAVDASRPLLIRDGAGEVINTRLVRWPGSETPWTTGQCLYGFGRPQ